MGWFDSIRGFFETAWSIPERMQYGERGKVDVEGAQTALKEMGPYEYGSGYFGGGYFPQSFTEADLESNRMNAAQEIALEQGEPIVKSSLFALLFNSNMKACYDDQHHGHCNPDAAQACQDLASSGDYSKLILAPWRRKLLNQSQPPQEPPSDTVIQREYGNEGIFLVAPDKTPESDGSNVFQKTLDSWALWLSNILNTPDYSRYLIIGGVVVLVILVMKK